MYLGFVLTATKKGEFMDVSKINFGKKGLNSIVGELEADILECLWQGNSKKTCREVYDFVKKKNKVAYTTVTVTMDRMFSRNLLERDIGKGRPEVQLWREGEQRGTCQQDFKKVRELPEINLWRAFNSLLKEEYLNVSIGVL